MWLFLNICLLSYRVQITQRVSVTFFTGLIEIRQNYNRDKREHATLGEGLHEHQKACINQVTFHLPGASSSVHYDTHSVVGLQIWSTCF